MNDLLFKIIQIFWLGNKDDPIMRCQLTFKFSMRTLRCKLFFLFKLCYICVLMYNPSGNCLTNDDRTQQELISFCKLLFSHIGKLYLIAPPPHQKKKKNWQELKREVSADILILLCFVLCYNWFFVLFFFFMCAVVSFQNKNDVLNFFALWRSQMVRCSSWFGIDRLTTWGKTQNIYLYNTKRDFY